MSRAPAAAAAARPCGRFRPRGRGLGGRAGLAARRAHLRGHPAPGAEDAPQQRRNVEIGVEPGPVQAEPGRADLDLGQVFGRGAASPSARTTGNVTSIPVFNRTTTRRLRRSYRADSAWPASCSFCVRVTARSSSGSVMAMDLSPLLAQHGQGSRQRCADAGLPPEVRNRNCLEAPAERRAGNSAQSLPPYRRRRRGHARAMIVRIDDHAQAIEAEHGRHVSISITQTLW